MLKINDLVGETETWIDMETRVRNDREWLDLDKVERVLEIAAPIING